MTSRERLMATLNGLPVDRPAVNFYEIGGFRVDTADPDPFNIYNGPSWRPLLQLAEEKSDLIRMRGPVVSFTAPGLRDEIFQVERYMENGSLYTRTTVKAPGRTLTALARRDPEVNTSWTLEHLLKDTDDLDAYLAIPDDALSLTADVSPLLEEEERLGDRGLVMVDTADPLCQAAALFSMSDYTIMAMTEPERFHALLQKCAAGLYPVVQSVASDFPGRLWRIYGPEYASEPYLPPRLFHEYVNGYTGPMVEAVQRYGGYARIHSHGRLRNILPHIAAMKPAGLDPVEPPPQGDMELIEIRRAVGKEIVLFGNIEASDLENLETSHFEAKVRRALLEGTAGEGRGFVLMPSASPYGRRITARTMTNYETMVRLAESFN